MTIRFDKQVHEWLFNTSPPLVGGARFSWSQVKYFCIHYCGAGKMAGKNETVILNNIQKDYVTDRGYSFGYSSAIGLSGTSYEGRGEVFRAASNGDETNKDDDLPGNPGLLDNLEVFSCLLIIGDQDEITPEMIRAVNALYSQMPNAIVINGHQDMDATACPGARAYEMVHNGTFHRNSIQPPLPLGRNIVIEKFTLLDPPDRFYDSRTMFDKKPMGPGVTKFGIKKYDEINFPKAVECTVTCIPQNMAEGDGFAGVGSAADSFVNWKQSDIGRPMPQTVWFPVDEEGMISVYSQDTIHILISCRAFA